MSKRKPIAVMISDTHLDDDNHEVNKLIYQQAIELTLKLGLRQVEHLGDLFHSRKAQTQRNLNCLGEIFKTFEDAGIQLNVVVGNHDKTEYSIAESFLSQYTYHPAVQIIPATWRRMATDKIYFHYIPFFADKEYLAELETVRYEKGCKNVLFTHIGVTGARMNNGTVIEKGITAGSFDKFDRVFIGHYHDAQSLSESIFYIGAALQHNYGEKPIKGATVLYDDLSTELVSFKFPQFLAFEISAKDLTVKDIKDFELTKKESGNNLRIILTGTQAEIAAVNKQAIQVTGVDVSTKQDAIIKQDVEESVVVFTDWGLLESFEQFCDKNTLDHAEGVPYLNKALKTA